MTQRGVILAIVAVGLVSAALWYWRGSSAQADVALTPAKSTAAMQGAFHGASGPAPIEPAPATDSAVKMDTAPTPEAAPPPPVSAPPEPPQSVDTPEPAQRKFARGTKPDDSAQN